MPRPAFMGLSDIGPSDMEMTDIGMTEGITVREGRGRFSASRAVRKAAVTAANSPPCQPPGESGRSARPKGKGELRPKTNLRPLCLCFSLYRQRCIRSFSRGSSVLFFDFRFSDSCYRPCPVFMRLYRVPSPAADPAFPGLASSTIPSAVHRVIPSPNGSPGASSPGRGAPPSRRRLQIFSPKESVHRARCRR
jgi:hypothetical protein